MKNILFMALISMMILLSSCEVIGGIFKAGVWVGILVVVAIVGVIIYIISKVSGRK